MSHRTSRCSQIAANRFLKPCAVCHMSFRVDSGRHLRVHLVSCRIVLQLYRCALGFRDRRAGICAPSTFNSLLARTRARYRARKLQRWVLLRPFPEFIHTHSSKHPRTQSRARTRARMHARTQARTNACTHTHAYTRTRTYRHTHKHMHRHARTITALLGRRLPP